MSSNANSGDKSGSKDATTGTNATSSAASGKGKSDYAYYKSFGGFNNFMHSYGLKPWDHDDIQEGKAIIAAMREADAQGA